MLRLSFAVSGVLLAFVAFAACGDSVTDKPCVGVPEFGCPLSHGVACEDPTCKAIYACRPNNVWELVKECPNYDPDAGKLPDAGTGTAIIDASPDAPPGAYGGAGCEILQEPDCALGLALACTNGCCGCEDLYVCTNASWELWGQCTPDGGVRYDPGF